MKKFRLSSESIFYLIILGVMVFAPVFVEWFQSADSSFSIFHWNGVLKFWRRLLPYVVFFILHNSLLLPWLLKGGRRRWLYAASTSVVTVLFFLFQCQHSPPLKDFNRQGREYRQTDGEQPDSSFFRGRAGDDFGGCGGDGGPGHGPDDGGPGPGPDDGFGVPRGEGGRPDDLGGPGNDFNGRDNGPSGNLDDLGERPDTPYPLGAQRELWDTLILLSLFGMNIGVKLYFRHRNDEHRMKELERANLHHTLTQLRYQLNPHLLMNTLNNIHSLIDIDPMLAQEAVVELSRLLRFVLYDADRERVLLRTDLEFIQHYVALMRVRYADTVRIDVSMPDVLPDVEVPPLLFISFVENAFKHGVSYQKESFIEIEESLSDDFSQLHFCCRNSNHGASKLEYGGVGLSNVRQRLKLLYGEDYTLDIDNDPMVYTVRLTIPLAQSATQAEKE